MSDPRCNCGEADCPICTAPAHQPWTPKAGTDPDPLEIANARLYEDNARLLEIKQWYERQSLRRMALVFLLTLVGGMIGGMVSAYTLSYYFN